MKIEIIEVARLKPNPQNARRHPKRQLEQIGASIKEFGFIRPVLVDGSLGIIAGHGSVEAAKLIGLAKVPVVRQDHLTPKQVQAYVIADNKLAENSEWDDDLLREEIGALDLGGFDLSILGFDDKQLGNLLESTDESKRSQANAIPETPTAPFSQLGDVWICGPHRVMCGDSTNATHVAALMNGELAQLVHADPPYGMGKQKDGVAGDNQYDEKLDAFQLSWWRTYRPHLVKNASAYLWGNAPDLWRLWYRGPRDSDGNFTPLGDTERMELRNEIVWDKKIIPGMKSELMTQYPITSERCLFFQLGRQFLGNVNTDDYPDEYEELRAYLAAEADSAGITPQRIRDLCGVSMYSHWFTKSQFHLIGRTHYETLQGAYPTHFQKPWKDLKRYWNSVKRTNSNALSSMLTENRSYFNNAHSVMRDVWEAERVAGDERFGHATPKPVVLMERAMVSSLPADGLCVEPFGGTGATLMGAERTGRRCFTMELVPAWADVIVTRWQQYSGQQAVHAETGKPFGIRA